MPQCCYIPVRYIKIPCLMLNILGLIFQGLCTLCYHLHQCAGGVKCDHSDLVPLCPGGNVITQRAGQCSSSRSFVSYCTCTGVECFLLWVVSYSVHVNQMDVVFLLHCQEPLDMRFAYEFSSHKCKSFPASFYWMRNHHFISVASITGIQIKMMS